MGSLDSFDIAPGFSRFAPNVCLLSPIAQSQHGTYFGFRRPPVLSRNATILPIQLGGFRGSHRNFGTRRFVHSRPFSGRPWFPLFLFARPSVIWSRRA